MEFNPQEVEGHPASKSGIHLAPRDQQPAPLVTTYGEDSRWAEADGTGVIATSKAEALILSLRRKPSPSQGSEPIIGDVGY